VAKIHTQYIHYVHDVTVMQLSHAHNVA